MGRIILTQHFTVTQGPYTHLYALDVVALSGAMADAVFKRPEFDPHIPAPFCVEICLTLRKSSPPRIQEEQLSVTGGECSLSTAKCRPRNS